MIKSNNKYKSVYISKKYNANEKIPFIRSTTKNIAALLITLPINFNHDIQAATEDSLRMMYGFQTLCENKDIPYLQMQGPFPIMSKSKFDNEKKLTATIINSIFLKEIPKATFLGWPIIKSIGGHCVDDYLTKDEKYVISKEDRHPNAKGHELISELLYEKFKSNYP